MIQEKDYETIPAAILCKWPVNKLNEESWRLSRGATALSKRARNSRLQRAGKTNELSKRSDILRMQSNRMFSIMNQLKTIAKADGR